jgi:hypothetical protein
MPTAVLDACCLIDLLVSGRAEAILRASPYEWRLPSAVRAEVRFVRDVDPGNPAQTVNVPVDLQPLFDEQVVSACEPEAPRELQLFVRHAARFRSDGEAACLALAEARGWVLATDDRRAIRVGQAAGLIIVSCPEIVRHWAEATRASEAEIIEALSRIERLAQFRPNERMPEYDWWLERRSAG